MLIKKLLNTIKCAWSFNWLLSLSILLNLLLVPFLLVALVIDPKVILGQPAWIKPLKFALSIAIYSATFLWLLTYVQGRRRWVQLLASGTGLALLVENILITLQVVRGTTSHFNVGTAFDAAIFSTMGMFIIVVTVLNLLLAFFLLRQPMTDRVFAWSLRLGLVASLLGMASGPLMTQPTPAQMAQLQSGADVAVVGAHSVGVPDGGPGLPLLGWSTTGGDLRVPHFFGLHGIQVLPFLGWWLSRRRLAQRFSSRERLTLLGGAGVGYIGFVGLLTWQALRGQPLLQLDMVTGIGYLVLVAVISMPPVALLLRRKSQSLSHAASIAHDPAYVE